MTKREKRINRHYNDHPAAAEAVNFNLDEQRELNTRESLPPDRPQEEEPSMTWVMLRELVETIVLSLIIFLLMRQVVQNYRIESQSMEPNFCEGQFILVNKLAYVLGEPKRGDVVVFHNPNNQQEDYIKRIMGLPGDTLTIRNQKIFINGNEPEDTLDEPYLFNQVSPGENVGPVVIEQDRLFVMGDNRTNSSDSRSTVGQLSQELLVGKAWLRVWPFERWGLINHFDLEPGIALDKETAAPNEACP